MSLDQYYTHPSIAQSCMDALAKFFDPRDYLCVEPSAGTGAFLSLCPPGSLGYDLDPKYPGIIEQDFLTTTLQEDHRQILVLGNPPFGKNASLALRFFNHAATSAEIIAFIVPRTFRKASMQNRLHRKFHLMHDEVIPKDSFIFEGETYDVPCVFQIWKRMIFERPLVEVRTTHEAFAFTDAKNADFALQRVGVNAGTVKTDLTVSRQSHYFIKGPVIDTFRRMDFESVKHNTAGNPSIAKSEIIRLYDEMA